MGLVENVKDVVKLVQQLDNVDLMRKMLDVQNDSMRLAEENTHLRKEVERLENALRISGDMYYENNAYWLKKSGEEKDGPYCPRCWDVDKQRVRMSPPGLIQEILHCAECGKSIPNVLAR